jgi:ribosome-associated protein
LEQLASLTTRKKKSATRLTKNSKIIKTIIAAIQEKKGENIISLDLRKINEAVADFFIICEASSPTQVRAIADNVQDKVKMKCEEDPYHHEGYARLQWVLIDYVNVVVHVMLPETGSFINWKKCGVMLLVRRTQRIMLNLYRRQTFYRYNY